MKHGKFIVFEGISGTGKETQAKLLEKLLKEKHSIDCCIVYHPTPDLKDVLRSWRKRRSISRRTEVYLLLADRYDRVRQEILPALQKGQWVISLRSYVSALVYQGTSEKERKWITSEFSRFEPKADMLFYFQISPQEALRRIQKRTRETKEPLGKYETKDLLMKKTREYEHVLKHIPHISLDASSPIESLSHTILSSIAPLV